MMHSNITTFFKALVCAYAVICAASCKDSAEPVQYSLPVVNFPMEEDYISAVVGEPVEFKAELVSGDKVSIAWYVDGAIQSSSQDFSYSFDAPGAFDVQFEARNGAGSVTHDYVVNVTDLLSISLSVKDSTRIYRLQESPINVAAIVKHGSGIVHDWQVDGVSVSDQVFFGDYMLNEARDYAISYHAVNSIGEYSQSFVVEVIERPLMISYSVTDDVVTMIAGHYLDIAATAIYGLSGLTQEWTINGESYSTASSISWYADKAGTYNIEYNARNAKGETASRKWIVNVTSNGYVFDDFEGISSLSSWWTLGQNQPGIQLCENPLKSGINTSDYCMSDSVNGSTSTSGYFDLTASKIASAKGIDLTKYTKLRFKVYFGPNKYYPRVQMNGGTKLTPVSSPKFNGGWEVLEYHFGTSFNSSTKFTIRAMYNEAGSNITGRDDATNTRILYFDDFEFVE